MKIKIALSGLLFLSTITFFAQKDKLYVMEDAYIQGGDSSGDVMSEKDAKKLLIFNSNEDNKYARTTYLKFKLPKKISEITSVELNVFMKVFKNDDFPTEMFNLDVVGSKQNNWYEDIVTFDKALELEEDVLASKQVQQSFNGSSKWVKVKLDTNAFIELLNSGKKNRVVTLALVNNEFNKISAMISSKEGYAANRPYLVIK